MTSHPPETPEDDAIGERIRAAAASVEAPQNLRRRIVSQRRAALARRRPRAWRTPVIAAALMAAFVATVLVAELRDAEPEAPSFAKATALALRAPASALADPGPPGTAPRMPAVDGLMFPSYAYSALDLRAIGVRRDHRRGRDVVAVSYASDGTRIGYAIVASPAIDVPHGARSVTRRGTRYALLRVDGAAVVTWRRAGRTCILASRTASHELLLRVAAWRAAGRAAS